MKGVYRRQSGLESIGSRFESPAERAGKKGHQTETGFSEESNSLPSSRGSGANVHVNSKGSSTNRPLDLRPETGKYERKRSDTRP